MEKITKTESGSAVFAKCAYLDQIVVPILLQKIALLSKGRLPNPFEFLALYLLKI